MTKEVTELKVGEGNTIAPFGNIASQVKELMDCLLSDNEIYRSFRVSEDAISLMAYPSASRESNYRCIAKAQLNSPKLKAYIDSQVEPLEIELAELKAGKIETIKALGQYCKGEVSDEKFAEIIGISLSELMDSF